MCLSFSHSTQYNYFPKFGFQSGPKVKGEGVMHYSTTDNTPTEGASTINGFKRGVVSTPYCHDKEGSSMTYFLELRLLIQ